MITVKYVTNYNEKGAANEHDATLSDSFVFIGGHKFRNDIRSTISVPTGLTAISLLPSFGLVKSRACHRKQNLEFDYG